MAVMFGITSRSAVMSLWSASNLDAILKIRRQRRTVKVWKTQDDRTRRRSNDSQRFLKILISW